MSKLELEIRPETPDDRARVFEIHEAAFGEPAEARLVDLLRPVSQPQISLVAVARKSAGEIEAGEVIGHVFFSPVEVGDASAPRRAIGLAPVAADPRCQRQGVGDALCRAGLARCLEIGEPVCFVLGHNTYYPRFGFEPARPHGLFYKSEHFDAAFFVAELKPGALQGFTGEVRYRPEFDEV